MHAAVPLAVLAVLCLQTITPVPPLPPPPFPQWMAELRAEAESRGIAPELLDRAFADIQPIESVLERDRTQAEFTLDLEAYLKRRLTRPTIRTAQQMHAKHRAVLEKIEKAYGVPSRVLVVDLGARVELRQVRRRPSDDPHARDARLRSPTRRDVPAGTL